MSNMLLLGHNFIGLSNLFIVGQKLETHGGKRGGVATTIGNDTVTSTTTRRPKGGSAGTIKVRKEKLGDRISSLQQIVSPYGKMRCSHTFLSTCIVSLMSRLLILKGRTFCSWYLKHGVNDKGRVDIDVETKHIVFEDNVGGIPSQISYVVQHRGFIPLFWSQESLWLKMKHDINGKLQILCDIMSITYLVVYFKATIMS